MARHSGKRKTRPCLRCDKLTETTPENRLCPQCKWVINEYGLDSGYSSKDSGSKQRESVKGSN